MTLFRICFAFGLICVKNVGLYTSICRLFSYYIRKMLFFILEFLHKKLIKIILYICAVKKDMLSDKSFK